MNRAPPPVAPASHVAGAGRGGVIPPPEHRWRKGISGNPRGRPAAGATIREWINVLVAQEMTEPQLRVMARDQKTPIARRLAAERILESLKAMETGDVSPLVKGGLDDIKLQD